MRLLLRSLQLDCRFLSLGLPMPEKISFLFTKYFVLFKEVLNLSSNKSTKVFGKKYFYDDKYGLVILQGTFVDNDFLKKFIKPNSIVVDVGANIGQFNIFCKTLLQAKRVYSFEPVVQTFNILKKNCSSHLFNAAVSQKEKLTFFIGDLSVWSSAINQGGSSNKVIVDGIKIDDVNQIRNEKVIDLFKVDTEGAELDVLKASRKVIKKSRYILIEVPFVRDADSDVYSMLTFLQGIIPSVKIVRIGRVYNNDVEGTTGAADILFYNMELDR